MPTYEYLCENCQGRFEEFQSITADVLRKCPDCGKMKLKRLIGTGAGVIFKGSGFYETDYRSDGYKQAVKKETSKDKDAAGKKDAADAKSKKTPEKSPTTSGDKTSDNNSSKKEKHP